MDYHCTAFDLAAHLPANQPATEQKAKAYNTSRAPQVTYRDFRGAGHVTGQASVGRRPYAEPALTGWPMTS